MRPPGAVTEPFLRNSYIESAKASQSSSLHRRCDRSAASETLKTVSGGFATLTANRKMDAMNMKAETHRKNSVKDQVD